MQRNLGNGDRVAWNRSLAPPGWTPAPAPRTRAAPWTTRPLATRGRRTAPPVLTPLPIASPADPPNRRPNRRLRRRLRRHLAASETFHLYYYLFWNLAGGCPDSSQNRRRRQPLLRRRGHGQNLAWAPPGVGGDWTPDWKRPERWAWPWG